MSLEQCEKCRRFVDTDENPDAYEYEDSDCNTIKLEYALCHICKDEFVALTEVQKEVHEFTGKIFDWVSLLGEQAFLGRCYEFSNAIDKYINPKKEA